MDENSKPPKQRWWQISLKTVLLAMLVIGAFLAGWQAREMVFRQHEWMRPTSVRPYRDTS